MAKRIIDNDSFVRKNLERLVNKYPRQRIVISHGEIFTGEDAAKRARNKYPESTPLSFPVPGPEEFVHILRIL